MATYLVLCSFTEQGIRTVKETANRADAVRTMAKKFGVTVKDIYWTLGTYDVATIFEANDEQAMTALALAIGQLGNVRTQMLRAFTQDEVKNILNKMSQATRETVPA